MQIHTEYLGVVSKDLIELSMNCFLQTQLIFHAIAIETRTASGRADLRMRMKCDNPTLNPMYFFLLQSVQRYIVQ